MKLRAFLIAMTMMSLTFVSAKAVTPSVPSPLINEDKILGSAYYDTLSILSTPNECSDFFGGPSASVDIFKAIIGKVRRKYFSPSIGIQMSGAVVNVSNAETKSTYRLFDTVSINANGPFYRKRFTTGQPFVPGVGTFGPNTKEARVLMFLHELGHVVKGQSGNWLLPDDGRDEALSRDNTRKIEDVCGDEIRNLGKGDAAINSDSGKYKAEKRDDHPSGAAPQRTPVVANTKP
jgi:hypothetical protein